MLVLKERRTNLSVLPAGLNLIHVKTNVNLAVLSNYQNYPQTFSLPVVVSLIVFIEGEVQYVCRLASLASIEDQRRGLQKKRTLA